MNQFRKNLKWYLFGVLAIFVTTIFHANLATPSIKQNNQTASVALSGKLKMF